VIRGGDTMEWEGKEEWERQVKKGKRSRLLMHEPLRARSATPVLKSGDFKTGDAK
jgi:hypothetical protein